MISSIVILILILLILIFWGVSHLMAVYFGAPIVSSDRRVVIEALKLANARPGEKLLDLGCGWGRVLHIAESRGLKTEGVEVSPAAVLWNRLAGRKVKFADLKKTDVSGFDIIYIYLLPGLIKKLKIKSKKGARIVAIDFPVTTWVPIKTQKVGRHTIYLYRP